MPLAQPDLVNPSPIPLSRFGLGCVTFGREIDAAGAATMMDHAVARGITFFDTAAAYGGGASETIVGQWLRDRRNRHAITLATKILPPYAPAGIEAAVQTSLERLKVATIDLLFLHRWDATVENEATLRALDGLVQGGSVRRLGASNFTAEQLERSLALQSRLGLAPFRALQNIHNLAVRGIDPALRQFCAHGGIEIITYSPLGAGFLTGKHEGGVQPGSRFDIIPGHQGVYFNDLARERLARLRTVSARSGIPMAPLALAWALRQPQVDIVLVGGRTVTQLEQAFQARSFTDSEWLRNLDAD